MANRVKKSRFTWMARFRIINGQSRRKSRRVRRSDFTPPNSARNPPMARNLARPNWCIALATAMLCGALLAATVGCGQSESKLPTASVPGSSGEAKEAAGASTPNVDAKTLLAQVVETYQQAKTYEDAGDLKLEFSTPEGEKQQSPAFPFSVAFERPNKIRIHALEASV